jgi:hypothetical protein
MAPKAPPIPVKRAVPPYDKLESLRAWSAYCPKERVGIEKDNANIVAIMICFFICI